VAELPPLQAGSSLKLSTGQFLNGRPCHLGKKVQSLKFKVQSLGRLNFKLLQTSNFSILPWGCEDKAIVFYEQNK